MLHPILHPIERGHKRFIIGGRTWSALNECEHLLRNQQDIFVCLHQLQPRAARFHERGVSPRTAAVLWRTVTPASRADGIRGSGIIRQDPIETNVVLPEVPHVVLIDKPLARSELEVGQPNLKWIVVKEYPARAIDTILLAMNAKSMQVQVFPSHRYLNNGMQGGNTCVTGDQQSPPDQRRTITERHLELIDGDGSWLLGRPH